MPQELGRPILAVVVRYKMALEESPTILSLCRSFDLHPELRKSIGLLIWDNSPTPLANPALPFAFDYRHADGQNLGVAGAYNFALQLADSQTREWLLLLDQDTTLRDDFLPRLLDYSRALEDRREVAAIVPLLLEDQRIISPMLVRPNHLRFSRPISRPFTGLCIKKAFAANSGTLMRVSALRAAGGYDEAFWLDISDVVVFERLYEHGLRLYVAGELRIQHRVTNNDYDGSMSPERYRNFIAAEGAYFDIYRTTFQSTLQTARLMFRAVIQYLRYRNKAYSVITREYILQRLRLSRKTRIELWKLQSLKRDLPAIANGMVVG